MRIILTTMFLALAVAPAAVAGGPAPMRPGDMILTVYSPDRELTRHLPAGWHEGKPVQSHQLLEAQARYAGLGVVRECRELDLPKRTSEYRFADVAALIDPTTTRFVDQSDPAGTRVLEQSFHYDLANEQSMLKRFVGRPIEFIDTDQRRHRGTLLASGPPLILQTGDGSIEMISYLSEGLLDYDDVRAGTRTFRFAELPKDLVTRPTLSWRVRAQRAGKRPVVLSYQTGGLAWRSDYTALINADDTRIDLTGWVTIANVSGARFANARLKLCAGDVRRFVPMALASDGGYGLGEDFFGDEDAEEGGFEEKAFFEYHLYTLRGRTTLENNQTKQIEFVNVPAVPVKKVYTYDGLQDPWLFGEFERDETYGVACRKTVRVNLEIENAEAHGLGIPLPGGVVRVHKLDEADGRREFIGEDAIEHTPRDETVRLYIGDAFDIVGERVRTAYEEPRLGQTRETFAIEIRNHKPEPATIVVLEHFYRGVNWKIEKNTLPFTKLDSQSIQFEVAVPANATVKVTYTAFYWWPGELEDDERGADDPDEDDDPNAF